MKGPLWCPPKATPPTIAGLTKGSFITMNLPPGLIEALLLGGLSLVDILRFPSKLLQIDLEPSSVIV